MWHWNSESAYLLGALVPSSLSSDMQPNFQLPEVAVRFLVISKRNTIHFMNGGDEKQMTPNENSTPARTVCFSNRCSSLAIMFHSKTNSFSTHRSSYTWGKTYSFIANVQKKYFSRNATLIMKRIEL